MYAGDVAVSKLMSLGCCCQQDLSE